MLIPGEEVSRVVLPGIEITMPASKNELGFELGRLIIMLGDDREYFRLEATLPPISTVSFGFRQRRVMSILTRGPRIVSSIVRLTTIMNENRDIVVRMTNQQ